MSAAFEARFSPVELLLLVGLKAPPFLDKCGDVTALGATRLVTGYRYSLR
jgi:hypothetical protein